MTAELIRRSLDGDEIAFAALYDQYKNLVYRTAYLMLGDADEAEDVLQEVFIQVHRALASYDPEKGALTTWLHRITVNRCLNQRRRARALISLRLVPQRELKAPEISPEKRVADDEEVRQALRRLNPQERATVVLRFYLEMSYAEIGEVMDVPLGTVQSRLNRALRKMRGALMRARTVVPTGAGKEPARR